MIGFAGAFISLLLSKWMAKRAYNIQLIDRPTTEQQRWLYQTIEGLARKAGIGMPEVGIYDSPDPNAFATGWKKHDSLVAVSTGLLNHMDQDECVGVLGHEISHIANGDMVTLALIQGVVNTFVIFFARIAAHLVASFLSRDSDSKAISGFAYYGIVIVFELIFGLLASMIVMAFSRWREYRADRGSAGLTSRQNMIKALQSLERYVDQPKDNAAPALSAFMISRPSALLALFSSHPPLQKRIEALQRTDR